MAVNIRSKTLRWVIIVSSIIVAVIISAQIFWLQKFYRVERRQFNINITSGLKSVSRNFNLVKSGVFNFEKNVSLIIPEDYLLKVDRIPSLDSISAFFSQELTDYNVLTDCNVSIYDASQKKFIGSQYIDMPNTYTQENDKFTTPVFHKPYSYISFYFPHRSSYIFLQMIFWIVSSAILLLVLIGFGISLFYLYQQRFLNETQKDFVNNFTHEFKTPLSVIKIAADVLHQPTIIEKPEKLSNYAEIIIDQTAYLQNQLNRMLVIAYTEHSTLPLQKEVFDVNALLEQAVNKINPLIEEKSGNLSMDFGSNNSNINADKSYILLAIINILENAVKYSVKPAIEIKTYVEGNDFCTAIKDNGVGIDKKQQRKVFNKFYRVTYGEIHQSKGFGLGLNFVKKIVEAHKGNIIVDSVLGSGSTFTIKIPRN